MKLFKVIDKRTGKEADVKEIVEQEEWADRLVWGSGYRFCLSEDGCLVLADEMGNFVFCDNDRFKVVLDTNVWFSVDERLKMLEKEIQSLSEYIKNAGSLFFMI